ncbi:MAG: hypothetical protein ACP5IK_02740 [Candidatus Micrarchaeia archaeon]
MLLPLFLLATIQTLSALNSNQTVFLGSGNYSLAFSTNTYNCKVVCRQGSIINDVVFGNDTFNNTLQNCTVFGNVLSMHNAENNLLNVTGNYSLAFADNSSSIGIGHFFHLLVLNQTGGYSVARFIEILPKRLVDVAPYLIAMYVPMSEVYAVAKQYNITLPSWGLQTNASSNGSTVFPIESELIYKGKVVNFNPYFYYTPYSGYDEISETTFNASSNVVYKPPYMAPSSIYFDEIFPAGKPVYWNFSVSIFNKSSNIFEMRNSPQSFPNGTIVATYHNITNGTVSYYAGIQKPGTYAFLGMFFTPYDHENTTSPFYSVGLAYCSDVQTIHLSGYYPFVYNSLTAFHVFWRTDKPCNIGATIVESNVTINCKGGYANETKVDFVVENANNVTIENCRLYGNGIAATNSQVRILNTTFIATNSSSVAVVANNSAIIMRNVSFEGFSNLLNATGSLKIEKAPANSNASATGSISSISTSIAPTSTTAYAQPYPSSSSHTGEGLAVFSAFALLGLLLIAASFILKRKQRRKRVSKRP